MEITAKNIDRLVTIGARWGGREDRDIIIPLYKSASKKIGRKPVSLVAAQKLIGTIKDGDSVFLIADFATYPDMPYGETDGPLGLASLARAIKFGLNAVPVLISSKKAMKANCQTAKAAGLNTLKYKIAKNSSSSVAVAEVFPTINIKKTKKKVTNLFNNYNPKAVISVETIGPNKNGIKHYAPGTDAEIENRLPHFEFIFFEAQKRGVLTIGCIDGGNELGSGTIESDIRRIVPYADKCRCKCKAGIACSVKADIVFPSSISNWGAYAITAMVAYLKKNPEILQDANTERRMLEACIMAGAVEGDTGSLIMSVDQVDHEAQEALITLMHTIIQNALIGLKVDRFD